MTDATAWPDVLVALVDGWRTLPGFRSPWSEDPGVTVYETVEVALSDDDVDTLVVVGWAGAAEADGQSGAAGQAVAGLGTARHREETGTVRCLLVVQTGDHEVPEQVARQVLVAAKGVLGQLDAWLRGNSHLGLMPQYPDMFARLGSIAAVRPFAAAGVGVEIEFDVAFRARV